MIEAVIFDMDGVIVDSEQLWDDVRLELTRDWGGAWSGDAQQAMMGMSSPEWSRYMHETLGVDRSPEEINEEVVRRMRARYEDDLPLIPGAVDAVVRLHGSVRLAIASSANRPLIDTVARLAGIAPLLDVTVSSEEVTRGKPSPDVYLEAARRLELQPDRCVAVEDSSNGLRAAHAAGLRVLALPNPHFPPAPDALALASSILGSLDELSVEALSILDGSPGPPASSPQRRS
jgi:HAD superfamily hydrolase (TIGR01509 family)